MKKNWRLRAAFACVLIGAYQVFTTLASGDYRALLIVALVFESIGIYLLLTCWKPANRLTRVAIIIGGLTSVGISLHASQRLIWALLCPPGTASEDCKRI